MKGGAVWVGKENSLEGRDVQDGKYGYGHDTDNLSRGSRTREVFHPLNSRKIFQNQNYFC